MAEMAVKRQQQRIAYSYIRFSSAQQEKGDSLRRQAKLRDDVLAEHPEWTLAETTYQDLGKSAFDGSNIADGALGAFITACEAGRIPRGSVLIIEQWDRLSRLPPVEAIELFSRITRCGVDICTAIDKEVHSRDSMKDTGNLFKSIIRMQVANEESEKKSKRVREAMEEKRRDMSSVMTTRGPGWLRWNGSAFEIIAERAKIIREIFQKTVAGKGRLGICNELNLRKEPNWGAGNIGGWWPCYISKILRNRAVIGEFQPCRTIKSQIGNKIITKREPDGEPRIDYFPRVISDVLWQKVQTLIAGSKKCNGAMPGAGRPGSVPVRNLFSGFIFDGYHPTSSMGTRSGLPYLASDWTRLHPGAQPVTWNIDQLESAILKYLRELDFASLVSKEPTAATEEESRLATIHSKLEAVKIRLEQLMDSFETVVDKQQRDIILKRIGERAKEKTALEQEEAQFKATSVAKKTATAALGDARKDLCKLLEAKDGDTRLKLRAEIRRIVARIDVFPLGSMYEDPDYDPPFFIITFKTGATRYVREYGESEVNTDAKGRLVIPAWWNHPVSPDSKFET